MVNNKEFVEELIYENIKLLDENSRLLLENIRLKNDLRELKRLERWWKGALEAKEEGEFVMIFKGSGGYKN